MGKILITLGIFFILSGLAWHFELLRYIPFGKMPGDITIDSGNTRIFLPIGTSVLLSIVLSFVFYLLRKL